MKNSLALFIIMILSCQLLTSCEVIGNIFGAGVYTGIFLVLLVVAVIVFAVVKMGKKD